MNDIEWVAFLEGHFARLRRPANLPDPSCEDGIAFFSREWLPILTERGIAIEDLELASHRMLALEIRAQHHFAVLLRLALAERDERLRNARPFLPRPGPMPAEAVEDFYRRAGWLDRHESHPLRRIAERHITTAPERLPHSILRLHQEESS